MHLKGELNEIIDKIQFDPLYALEKDILRNQVSNFISLGDHHKTIQNLDLLQEYGKILFLLRQADDDNAILKLSQYYLVIQFFPFFHV